MAFPGRTTAETPVSAPRAGTTSREAAFDRLFEEFSAPIFNYVLPHGL